MLPLRAIVLLFGAGLLVIPSAQSLKKALVLNLNRPLMQTRDKDPLQLVCVFYNDRTKMTKVDSLTVYRSDTGKKDSYTPIASVTPSGATSGLSESELIARGRVKLGGQSNAIVTYASPNVGYCVHYKCVVEGTDKKGRFRSYTRKIRDRCSKSKSCCAALTEKITDATTAISKVESEVNQCKADVSANSKEIQNNAQKLLDVEAGVLEAANKLASIDREKYIVSSVYKGSVYLISSEDKTFDIEGIDKLCVDAGGYLVEIDDADEHEFVKKFSAAGGGSLVYTGINDIETEGTFVYTHSKKPLPNLAWKPGNPDNYGGGEGEDCVNVATNGINDLTCKRNARYMCEIPLL
ncbi:collectin-11 [Plakobranchus ocellatus]|uniref:Collectin-11 n=1 Tax=Plakobranchus ocellatus TaxID=259542 RepID=A0AAV4BF64_9GAST|nr:collectin-11 [Plakobranchus ocellatus]